MQLRPYQEGALSALFDWFQTRDGDPLVVLPTGAGKSLLLSAFLQQARANYPALRAVVLATQAELVKQNVKAAATLIPRADIGIYSAGLGEKDATLPITVANIQSIARQKFGVDPFDVIIVDEAHTIADEDAGQYRAFLAAQRLQNPQVKVVGLTATPYKLSSGRLDEGTNALFSGIAYQADVVQLIHEGYLCRPITPRVQTFDVSGVQLRGGEFVAKALADAVDVDALTNAAADEMVARFSKRNKWLVFAVSVEHARHVAQALSERGVESAVVHGELSRDERAYRLHSFTEGTTRALVNCQLLTTGFDAPNIDAIAMLRPTKSAGLYVQMLGRGMRVHPSKTDCLVLDFAGNIERHGPIDAIRVRGKKDKGEGDAVAKVCPSCELWCASSVRECPNCAHQFPPPPVPLTPTPSTAPLLSQDQEPSWHTVTSVQYMRNAAKAPKTTDTLRVEYYEGYKVIAREWVCLEHTGFARTKAEQWWSARSPDRCPATIDEALALADDLRAPLKVGLLPDPANPKYDRIAHTVFTEPSNLPRACWSCDHFSNDRCTHWDDVPPPHFQLTGCDAWTDEALPF